MNEQQTIFFEALSKNRAESAKALEGFALRGVKDSVVEKYSDQAHFIYELLQNADDAKATSARFELHKDRLVFSHNGTRRFTVSNPETEEEDHQSGALGDINAITAVGGSNKQDEATIGKFGIGFKAVFQYTSTPHIYDPNVFFKIERFIVPTRIASDYDDRHNDETLFVFPFDHNERSADEAFLDISDKLHSLYYPILFLANLKDIIVTTPDGEGLYAKTVNLSFDFDGTTAEQIVIESLTQSEKDDINERLWLFSRSDKEGHRYSVGFFVDLKGNLVPKHGASAFCFFPTKESTGLNFIVHAPFLLTDSREGIRAGVKHNNVMISSLAELAADCFGYFKLIEANTGTRLINDNIFDIIPYKGGSFSDPSDKSKVSFKPFFTAIKSAFETNAFLPCEGGFTFKKDAYWLEYSQWKDREQKDCLTTQIFTNDQLALITGNPNAKWVFPTFSRAEILRSDRQTGNNLAGYIDDITSDWLGEDKILGRIDERFIETQPIEWLHSFYNYVSATTGRTKLVRTAPIFLNDKNKAVAALDSHDQPILFLPTDTEGYETVLPALLDNTNTAEFLNQLGVKKPALHDEIYNRILPLFKEGKMTDSRPYFIKLFDYYKQCPQTEIDRYIDLIKEYDFIRYRTSADNKVRRGKAASMYFPTDELKAFFASKDDTRFVALDEYYDIVEERDKKQLESFFTELGVNSMPRIISRSLSTTEAFQLRSDWSRSTGSQSWTESQIDGCEQILSVISDTRDIVLSKLLWDTLLSIIASKCNNWNTLDKILIGTYTYYYRTYQHSTFISHDVLRLRNKPWLVNKEGDFVAAGEITVQTLSDVYAADSSDVSALINFLGIREVIVSDEEDNNLTEEQKYMINIAERLVAAGFSESEIENLISERQNRLANALDTVSTSENDDQTEGFEDSDPEIARVVKEIAKRATSSRHKKNGEDFASDNEESAPEKEQDSDITEDEDADEYIKPPVDYSKKIEQAMERNAAELGKIAHLDELTRTAAQCEKYSFAWFKALIELEVLSSVDDSLRSREVSITFAKVERELGTARTLALKHPSRFIPQFMEDLADIPLILYFNDRSPVKVAVEVVSVKSYDIRAKLKTGAEIQGIDLGTVKEARIDAKNPVFLLGELQRAFNKLDFADDYNLRDNLCKNIEFVFGPPGTGKTTYLASKIIMPLMRQIEEVKVLVLTPTNKAADVLVKRVMEMMGREQDSRYLDWLVRFGATNDNEIEQSGVFRDKTFDVRSLTRNVTVTTIARFPYDYFMPGEERLYLNALNWDYIVIDEASMIPLMNIVYALYKKTPKKFIIAGDPFQIEPITSVDIWKDENIYTMVELDSFTDPKTVPHRYPVELLTTQYRSIPAIGEVFSKFAYGGVLKHARTEHSQRQLDLGESLNVKALNIVKFPVSKYESIYRPKKLNNSSNYQVYSSLFAFEFVRYISNLLAERHKDEFYRIGIIAPYRAQSDLIDKLMSSYSLPENVDVQVGTIHGFQGDECDIIFAMFNPPPTISGSSDMFLNKRNIVNVSISRARDYLFVLMPNDATEKVQNLKLVKRVEALFKSQGEFTEEHTAEIEKLIFGSSTFIEDNAFSTSHQLVNVYSEPERRYEVRTEENAVDVQIHETVISKIATAPSSSEVSEDISLKETIIRWSEESQTDCENCTHPSGLCSGSCQNCLDEIHWGPTECKRTDYDCKRLLRCYVGNYTERYFWNIKSACKDINFGKYPTISILSLGCGTSPDLMAFQDMVSEKSIRYNGIDKNSRWGFLQNLISEYAKTQPNLTVRFENRDILQTPSSQPVSEIYNVVVLQFVISSVFNTGGKHSDITALFNGLVHSAVKRWRDSDSDSPFLFVLNDVDSMNKGRSCFFELIDTLEEAGYKGSAFAFSSHESGDLGRTRWSNRNGETGYGNIVYRYSSCTSNNSASLVIEVTK